MDARLGKDEFFVEIESRLACRVNTCDACLAEHPWDVVWDGIADGCVRGSRDVADGEHIPQGDVPLEDELLFLFGRRRFWCVEQFCHERPEAVLRVGVIETVLHGLRRRHGAEHKPRRGRTEDGFEGMFAFFDVHRM